MSAFAVLVNCVIVREFAESFYTSQRKTENDIYQRFVSYLQRSHGKANTKHYSVNAEISEPQVGKQIAARSSTFTSLKRS